MAACALSGCHVANAAVSSSSSYGVRPRSSSCQENSVVVTTNVAGIAVPGASLHAPLRADAAAGRRRWSVGIGLSYGASLAGTRLPEDNVASCRYLNARWKSIGRLTCQAQAAEIWEGKGVVASARKLIGVTNPLEADPGTIRGDFAVEVGRNVVHGSDSIDNGEREIGSEAKQALLSLSDKTDLLLLANGLSELGYSLISTGGTASALEKEGLAVRRVEHVTNFPEMLDGRVKTLHPAVHGGILARRGLSSHMSALQDHGIGTIDLVVVNLYPFYSTVTAKEGTSFAQGIENIDIGGPTMIRAAAKNHEDVLVVVDPADYASLLDRLRGNDGGVDISFRRKLAWKAFQHVASYDAAVAEWLWQQTSDGELPPSMTVPMTLYSPLRYGENPHQKAGFYVDKSLTAFTAGGIGTAVQHHGKEMSYNNYLDADAAWNCVCEFVEPTCVVVKHTNPCGVASSTSDLLEAYRMAVRADPVSAFGGIVAFNVPVDEDLARELREFRSPTDGETRMFYEIVVAPSYTEKGLEVLKGKSKALRILEAQPTTRGRRCLHQVAGGWLHQTDDDLRPEDITFTVATEKAPTAEELEDAKFAWRCVKHVKSNAITIAKGGRMLGMGSGQPNRVKSAVIAIEKAEEEIKGSALASDAFFPFAWGDAVEKACEAGVSVIVQPGGSIRDQDAIDCCNKYGTAMLFTGVRHFRH